MNKPSRVLLVFTALIVCAFTSTATVAQVRKNVRGEEFFIIASVDLQKSQLLVKRPTEVTLLMLVNDRTEISSEDGKRIQLADLRSGDTIWAVSTSGSGGKQLALRIRKGPMTVADLRRLYLAKHTPQ